MESIKTLNSLGNTEKEVWNWRQVISWLHNQRGNWYKKDTLTNGAELKTHSKLPPDKGAKNTWWRKDSLFKSSGETG